MKRPNPEIEAHLDKLADLCCEALTNGDSEDQATAEELLKSLLMSGYARLEGRSLTKDVEIRVKERCRDAAMPRGAVLSAMTSRLEQQLSSLARWQSRSPGDNLPPKTANISTPTDR